MRTSGFTGGRATMSLMAPFKRPARQDIVSDLVANVAQVHVSVGDKVEAGQELVLLESMKMEIPVVPEWEGTVTDVRVVPGDVVQEGDIMVVLE